MAAQVLAIEAIGSNLSSLLLVQGKLTELVSLQANMNPLLALSGVRQELLNAEIYIRSFEDRFGDADGAFALATGRAETAAQQAIDAKNEAVPAAQVAVAAQNNIDAFLMATTTEQVRMAAFIVEINNRTLV